MKRILPIAVLLALALGACSSTEDAPMTSGSIEVDEVQVAFIASGNIGGGTLSYDGKSYDFSIGGLGVGGIGISEIRAKGTVHDLHDVADFAGIYGQARAGAVAGDVSAGGLWLTNTNGVTISLDGEREGLMLSIGADGIIIEMK